MGSRGEKKKGAQKNLFFLMKKMGALNKKKAPEGHTMSATKNSIKSAFYSKKTAEKCALRKKMLKKKTLFLKGCSPKKKKGFAFLLDIENFSSFILHSPIVTSINTWSYPTVVLVKVAPLESS